jgi:hypothetical protein
MSEQDTPLTPEQEKQLDRLLSDGRLNAHMARRAVLSDYSGDESQYEFGDGPDESQHDIPEPKDEEPLPDPHRRVSPHHTKPGHVRDFADGGRADEYRIYELGEPQTEEDIEARQAAMPEIAATGDDIAQARLMDLLKHGYTHAEIQALWNARVERLGRHAENDEEQDD